MGNFNKSLQERYKASNIFKVRCKILDKPGKLAMLISEIGELGANVDKVDIVGIEALHKTRDITVFCPKECDSDALRSTISSLDGIEVVEILDEVIEIHRRGTIQVKSRVPINNITDLRMVYTPGVAAACKKIVDDPDSAWQMTGICDRVAIVTDGTAVLGLGDIGPSAALPVMEGKAAIFAEFVGVSAFPIVIDSKDPQTIIENVALISKTFGAIQLEDIAAPACFEIEEKLRDRLDIPVFHDDQHATATVALAAVMNALRHVDKKPQDCRAIIIGAGAAGYAITKILIEYGLEDIVVYDAGGAIYQGRTHMMNPYLEKLAQQTNKNKITGPLEEGFKGRDIFIGVARPNLVTKEMIASMAKDAIAFPMSNPIGEISVEDALEAGAKIAADGRTINNALAFPGLFRGALDARAKDITPKMQMAAADMICRLAPADLLLPDMLDREIHKKVAQAVAAAAVCD